MEGVLTPTNPEAKAEVKLSAVQEQAVRGTIEELIPLWPNAPANVATAIYASLRDLARKVAEEAAAEKCPHCGRAK